MRGMKKKLVFLCHHVLGSRFMATQNRRDTIFFPAYLAHEYGLPWEIVTLNDEASETREDLPAIDGRPTAGQMVKLANKRGFKKSPQYPMKHPIKSLLYVRPFVKYIVKNRKDISHFLFFHYTYITWLIMFFCRRICPHARIYLKLDTSADGANRMANAKPNHNTFWRRFVLKRMHSFATSLPHLITAESLGAVEALKANPFFAKRNVAYAPNGMERRAAGSVQKQKRFFTVGRLGTEQKNTELLLAACAAVDLKDWQF